MLGSHSSLLRAVGTLLRRASEHHYLHFLYLTEWGALHKCFGLPAGSPLGVLGYPVFCLPTKNKQEQGITTNSWPPCQEPLQPPLGSTPGESLHIYHFCTRPHSVQRTKERLYREWWGATGALQRFGNSTRLEAPQLFPCSCLRHPPHLHRVGKVLWLTCKVPAVCS